MAYKYYTSGNFEPVNRAFLFGDAVKVSFFMRNGQLILAEECYFFLMASMRKMRMNIPLNYTFDFFRELIVEQVLEQGVMNAVVHFMAYRNADDHPLPKSGTSFYFEVQEVDDVLALKPEIELDMIREISVNTNLLSNIRVHCPENVYAEIYARENDLDDVILLNPQKRMARTRFGNLLLLHNNVIRVPKQSEGAYISPLMESFITFVHKNNLAEIEQEEMIAFETQKADEILMISDEKGVFPVGKIRNKTFGYSRFSAMTDLWKATLLV